MSAIHRRRVARYPTAKRTRTKVAPAKRSRMGSLTPARYQTAIEHQAPTSNMTMAKRTRPVRRARHTMVTELSLVARLEPCSSGRPSEHSQQCAAWRPSRWRKDGKPPEPKACNLGDRIPPDAAAGCAAPRAPFVGLLALNAPSARPALRLLREYERFGRSPHHRRRSLPDRCPPRR